ISFSLPQESNVELIVSDLLGQTISTLLNDKLNAGRHSIDFDANSLSSGIYVYTLKVNDGKSIKVESRKMTLIK
ncbi:MAG: T9SS type A sorting domain-containing protein, partial [Ignavibacterium sp.]|nr:T9SS type A sorting domain-containing protein [Ignavibacterium sp.]MDW8374199.1 T9SS type A sorting domain-containing protein [Ignavibacteriales bacterium]